MILGFNKQFVLKIRTGKKIHTIREDKNNRWKRGIKIQMATGVRTKNYEQFCGTFSCEGIQTIEFKWKHINKGMGNEDWTVRLFINGIDFTNRAEEIALNDGFDNVADFFKWKAWYRKNFIGKIIHWTDKWY